LDELKWSIAREIPHLRRYARSLLHDVEAADDLVQDCLERALRKRHLWSRRGSLRSWLFRILYTQFLNGRPRRRRERMEDGGEATEIAQSVPAAQEAHLEARDVVDAVARLPDDQRAVILLVALEGMSYDEAAGVLGIPIGTLRSRLWRGREALRQAAPARRGDAHSGDERRRPKLWRVK